MIHIGNHKSGTTSIQNALVQNAAALSRMGVLVPETGRKESGHHLLPWSLRQGRKEIWDMLIEEIENWGGDRIVVSSESFTFFKDRHVHLLNSYLRGIDVAVLVYVRDPRDFVVSAYRQTIKEGSFTGSVENWIREYWHRCNYLRLVQRWDRVCSSGKCDVHIFEKAAESGVVGHFMHTIGVDPGALPSIDTRRQNVSLDDTVVKAIRCVWRFDNRLGSVGVPIRIRRNACRRLVDLILGRGGNAAEILFALVRQVRPAFDRSIDEEVTPEGWKWLAAAIREPHAQFLETYIPAEDRHYFRW